MQRSASVERDAELEFGIERKHTAAASALVTTARLLVPASLRPYHHTMLHRSTAATRKLPRVDVARILSDCHRETQERLVEVLTDFEGPKTAAAPVEDRG